MNKNASAILSIVASICVGALVLGLTNKVGAAVLAGCSTELILCSIYFMGYALVDEMKEK